MSQQDLHHPIQTALEAELNSRGIYRLSSATANTATEGFEEPSDFYKATKGIPSSDLDSASFLHGKFADSFTYIPTSPTKGDWYFWDGAIHSKHSLNQVDDYLATDLADFLRDFIEDLTKRAKKNLGDEDKKIVLAHLKRYGDYARGIRSATGLNNLKHRIGLSFTKPVDHFDNDSQCAVLADGKVLDLTKLDQPELLDADPKRPVSRALGVQYRENEGHPAKWIASLSQWVPDHEVQKYLQVAAGAALLGKGDAENIVALDSPNRSDVTAFS